MNGEGLGAKVMHFEQATLRFCNPGSQGNGVRARPTLGKRRTC